MRCWRAGGRRLNAPCRRPRRLRAPRRPRIKMGAGGGRAIEVPMSTPKAIAGIEALADQMGDKAVIGVGTVLDASTPRDAINAGAQFVVSPTFHPAIVATTRRYGKISIPGAYTPTE